MMLQKIVLRGALVICSMSTLVAQAQEPPVFKKLIPTDAVRFASVFSGDSRVGAMIFDNLIEATDIGRGELPSVGTKEFSYVLTPDSKTEVSVVQIVRGFVSTQVSGNASLMIHSGGKPVLVDWKKAIAAAKGPVEPKFKELKLNAREKDLKSTIAQNKDVKFDDFLFEFKRKVPAGKPLQTTMVLLVDRLTGDDGSGAMIAIDSIDFEVLPAK